MLVIGCGLLKEVALARGGVSALARLENRAGSFFLVIGG